MTKEEAIRKHRILWNAIADETEKKKCIVGKAEIFNKVFPSVGRIIHYCFLCEYNKYNVNACQECLLERNKEESEIGCLGGLYNDWVNAQDWQESARIARKIANLPERRTTGAYENQ